MLLSFDHSFKVQLVIQELMAFLPETIDCRYNGALSLELSNDHPNMHIIHRKVALILGQWVSEVT
jgi:hypothetical protein